MDDIPFSVLCIKLPKHIKSNCHPSLRMVDTPPLRLWFMVQHEQETPHLKESAFILPENTNWWMTPLGEPWTGRPTWLMQRFCSDTRVRAIKLEQARTWNGSPFKQSQLVKNMMVKSLEEIPFCPAHQESEITSFFLVISLKGEVLKIMPIQKKTCAGQWARFKAFVIKDYNIYVSLVVRAPRRL